MIEFFSNWAEGIVIAVVIATIIELLLPESQNKKYVKMIVGVYIVFVIISPCIRDFPTIEMENWIETPNQTATTSTEDYTQTYIVTLYKQNLVKDMTSKLAAKHYKANWIAVEVQEDSEEMPIESIQIQGIEKMKQGVQTVEKVEIMESTTNEETITTTEIQEIQEEFSQTYAVAREKITIS